MTLPDDRPGALDLLWALILENGRRWGECATDFQKVDVEAIFAPDRPHNHFLTRPRGASKTTDTAAVALSWLAMEAPPRARGYVVASNSEQAAELIDAAASLVMRTPELEPVIRVENERMIAPNGAWVRVLAQSDSGAWGKRDAHLLICDEFAQWPETRGAKRVWTAVRSTVQKVLGCRLIILTSAGEPSHWSHGVLEMALRDRANWRVHEVRGPVPWHSPEDLQALERELLPSEYDRLVLNIWSESEDRAITPEDYEAARGEGQPSGIAPAGVKGGGVRLCGPRPGLTYIETVDVGTRNDATVLAISHRKPLTPERRGGPSRLVVDHLERWQGSKRRHVQLAQVEERVEQLSVEYNRATVYADPDQFVGSLQSLVRQGVKAKEWVFSATSVGQLATALVQTFRNRLIELPHTPELENELLRVRLRETAPGVTRLDHDRDAHDDQAVVIGMACHILLGTRGFGSARDFIETVREAGRLTEERHRAARTTRRVPAADRDVFQRRLRRRERVDEAQERYRASCTHRWRADRCVFCGGERQVVAP